jgi:hypothetical protein
MSNGTTNHLNIALAVVAQENGHIVCERRVMQEGQSEAAQVFYGQTRNHAIAIALEQLAEDYRKAADSEVQGNWEAVERLPSGDTILNLYHVVLHYERIAEDESRFEAMHNTLMGNTVVENATLTVIPIDDQLPIEPILRAWSF